MPIASQRSTAVFQKLERDLSKLSDKPQAKSVHRFRTGTRRLQILLDELSPKLDRSEKKLLKLLGKIRKRAGKVRDLDVQSAALRNLKVPREPRRKTQLVNQLIELRGQQEKKLRKAVDASTVREIHKRLKRAAKRFDPKASPDPLAVARAMLKPLDRAAEPLTESVLHQYRILSKRARYAAEFAIPSAETEKFIADIKRLQDALGDWHDWLTLTQTASQNLGDVRESPLVAELHNVTGAKYRQAVAVLTRARSKPEFRPQHPAKTSASVSPEGDSLAASAA
jgi:CHAD domain-containing protein